MNTQIATVLPLIIQIRNWNDKKRLELKQNKLQENLVPVLPKDATDTQIEDACKKIPDIEKEVKRFSYLSKSAKDERLIFTRKIDEEVVSKLMEIEKFYETSKKSIEKDLLPLKIAEEAMKQKKLKRANELVEFKRSCLYDLNAQIEEAKKSIQSKVSEIYTNALNDEIEMPSEVYLESADDSFSEDDFICRLPDKTEDKEKNDIIDLVYSSFIPSDLLESFTSELEKAFANFEVAKKDKIAAIKMREEVAKAAEQEASKEANINNSFVSVINVRSDELFTKTKTLKKKWVVTEPKTLEGMFNILKAFSFVLETASPYYKGQDYFDVVEKISDLLGNMKNSGVDIKGVKFEEKPVL